jgi:hypothetical protein
MYRDASYRGRRHGDGNQPAIGAVKLGVTKIATIGNSDVPIQALLVHGADRDVFARRGFSGFETPDPRRPACVVTPLSVVLN